MKSSTQVLIVDGNPNDVQVVRSTLESAGLSIHVRTDGISAIEAFHAIKPDVVLIDVQVPETDGVRVSRELKQTDLGRATPIVLMSRRTLKSKERKHALNASGCALLLQKPVTSKQILETIAKLLPNAFAAQGDAAESPESEPDSPARTAAGSTAPASPAAQAFDGEEAPLLDPEALNDEVLGALFDQVFPASDAGDLARAIAAKTQPDLAVDPPAEIVATHAQAPGSPGPKPPQRRPAFDASEDSLTSLLDEALPSEIPARDLSAAPSVDAEVVGPSAPLVAAPLAANRPDTAAGAPILEGNVVASSVTLTPSATASAPTPAAEAETGLLEPADQASAPLDAPSTDASVSLEPAMTAGDPGLASSSAIDASWSEPESSEVPLPVPSPYDSPLPAEDAPPASTTSVPAAPPRHDRHGKGKKSRGHRRDRGGSPASIPLSPPPTQAAAPASEPEPPSYIADEEETIIRPTPLARTTSEEPTTEARSAPRASRLLTILFFLLAAATILYILLRHRGEEDLRPASRGIPAPAPATARASFEPRADSSLKLERSI